MRVDGLQANKRDISFINGASDSSICSVEFSRSFLSLLRCSRDGGELSLCAETKATSTGIIDGRLRCVSCSSEYPIEDGIARMMTTEVTPEDKHEMSLKDLEYKALPKDFTPAPSSWRSEYMDLIEVGPHLNALRPLEGRKVLELACGDGRYTVLMAQMGADVLAVDFAIEGLRKLAANLVSGNAPTNFRVVRSSRAGKLTQRVGLVPRRCKSSLHRSS
jgi:uncharacterized protein YbaR (Trm112 family)